MAILQFRKDKISKCVTHPGYTDDNGDWHEGIQEWGNWHSCDAVPSGNGQTRTFADGKLKAYQYTVHLNADSEYFADGDKVRIQFRDGRIKEYSVLGFLPYQLKCLLWV